MIKNIGLNERRKDFFDFLKLPPTPKGVIKVPFKGFRGSFDGIFFENKIFSRIPIKNIHEMSMIRKTPTEDEYGSCEFHVTY